jgi:predicted trehalose synthase
MRERALPDLPLRDVAGMLRSFEYASAVGAAPDPTAWAAACRHAFLDAYQHDAPGPAFDEGLLRALQLDKAVYEAIYEARNRPDWLAIPLAGIDAALG